MAVFGTRAAKLKLFEHFFDFSLNNLRLRTDKRMFVQRQANRCQSRNPDLSTPSSTKKQGV
jgi:hypothetical protein